MLTNQVNTDQEMSKQIMPNKDIENKIIDTIFSSLNLKHINREEVNESTPITNGGLNLDSVDILEIIVQFEHKFGIKLSESESYAEHFKNIGTVTDFIVSKMPKA